MMNASQPQPAWYIDPDSRSQLRFHDGKRWTDQRIPLVDDQSLPSEPGLYPDPLFPTRLRYFNGTRWTDDVQPMVIPGPDIAAPISATQPAPMPVPTQQVASNSTSAPPQEVLVDPNPRAWKGPALWAAGGLVAFAAAVGIGVVITSLIVNNPTDVRPVVTPDTSPTATPTATATDSATPASSPRPTPTPEPEPQPPGPPEVSIQGESGSTEFYDVSWDQVSVSGPDGARETRINTILDDFTGTQAREYLEADGPVDQTGYWVPGFYEASIEQVSCPEPYLCFVQRGGSMPAGGVSGYYFTETLVVDYEKAQRVDIRDFVAEDQLLTLVTKAEQAITTTDEYASGIPLALVPEYDQFRNVIPQREGLLIYYSEQEIGSSPVEVLVYWDLPQ